VQQWIRGEMVVLIPVFFHSSFLNFKVKKIMKIGQYLQKLCQK